MLLFRVGGHLLVLLCCCRCCCCRCCCSWLLFLLSWGFLATLVYGCSCGLSCGWLPQTWPVLPPYFMPCCVSLCLPHTVLRSIFGVVPATPAACCCFCTCHDILSTISTSLSYYTYNIHSVRPYILIPTIAINRNRQTGGGGHGFRAKLHVCETHQVPPAASAHIHTCRDTPAPPHMHVRHANPDRDPHMHTQCRSAVWPAPLYTHARLNTPGPHTHVHDCTCVHTHVTTHTHTHRYPQAPQVLFDFHFV